MADFEELRQEAEFRRCRGKSPTDLKAFTYFCTTYVKIQHPEKGAILFDMRDAQRSTAAVWIKERMSITLKARQIGFSTLVMALALWLCMFWPDKLIVALSKKEDDAQKLFAKATYAYDRLPEWMRQRGPRVTSRTLGKMTFDNGSSIESLPANDPARGMSAYLIVVDEWAFFPDPEAAWNAIEPATDIGGRIICLSTANGSGNLYHQMVVGAMTGTNAFKFIFHSWRAVSERDDAWYEAKKRSMLEWQLHQEYPTTPEEAFIKSGRVVFDIDGLDRIVCEPSMRGYLQPHELTTGNPHPRLSAFIPNGDGPLHVWEMPQMGNAYVIGADVAEGLEHGDFSVAHVINVRTGAVVAKWRGHVDPDLFGSEILFRLGHWYNRALIGPEANNHGYTTIVALNRSTYPNLYYRHSYDERTNVRQKKLGWMTTAKTKPLLVDELARDLRTRYGPDDELIEEAELRLLDEETIGELRTFVRDENGKMHGSPFDDQVMSLGIANQMRKHWFNREPDVDESYAGTLQAVIDEADRLEGLGQGEWRIGVHSVRR